MLIGVPHTDVHFWQHAGLGPWKITDKTALGHESGGIVLEVGEGVTNVKPGDRVAIEPGVPCGKATCNFCLTGQVSERGGEREGQVLYRERMAANL